MHGKGNAEIFTGRKVGRLTILNREPNGANGSPTWLARCDCGTTRTISSTALRSGTKSCGCLRKDMDSGKYRREKNPMGFQGRLELTDSGLCVWCGSALTGSKGKQYCTLDCRNESRNERRRGVPESAQNKHDYYLEHRERILKYSRRNYFKSKYGITPEEAGKMSERQSGMCAICGEFGKLVVDHDHTTGKIRSMLCSLCNAAIGMFREDGVTMTRAIEYLGYHS